MQKSYLIKGFLPLAAGMLLTGCVDDDYDVSNIDTTSQVTINDLTIPVPLGEIAIDKVIDIDEDDANIKTIVTEGGKREYAILKDGEINTDEFKINPIHVSLANAIQGNTISISNPNTISGVAVELDLPVPHVDMRSYDLSMNNIDKSLVSLTEIEAANPIDISVSLNANRELLNAADEIAFENLKFQLPTNLVKASCSLGTYKEDTGILTLNDRVAMNSNGQLTIRVTAEGIGNSTPIVDHSLNIKGDVGLEDGSSLYIRSNGNALPSQINIDINYKINDFDLASFSGDVDYAMDDINISPISLDGLPGFLDSPETEIRLANPVIKININNPVGVYGMKGQGDLVLTSEFNGQTTVASSKEPFKLKSDNNVNEIIFDKTNVTNLQDILCNSNAGGLPQKIKVAVKNLSFTGTVSKFPIYHNGQGTISGAHGEYSFSAPLGFEAGSMIVYERTEDGWYSDDLAGLNIKTLHLKATCDTDLPVGLHLVVKPIDKDGNLIPVDENSNKFVVNGNSRNVPVELIIKAANGGTINDLDGVQFKAIVKQDGTAEESTNAIGPDQYIKLNNLRVTVDGYYVKEF